MSHYSHGNPRRRTRRNWFAESQVEAITNVEGYDSDDDGESDEEQECDVVDEEEEVVEANFDTNPSNSNE